MLWFSENLKLLLFLKLLFLDPHIHEHGRNISKKTCFRKHLAEGYVEEGTAVVECDGCRRLAEVQVFKPFFCFGKQQVFSSQP